MKFHRGHRHQCAHCHTLFLCTAPIEQHGESSWEWHCTVFEEGDDKICKDCYDGPPDGDAWSGGFAENH